MTKRLFIALLGVAIGVLCAMVFTFMVLLLYPIVTGAGGDNMTQGILGTIVLAFSTPIFAVVGGVFAYRKYR